MARTHLISLVLAAMLTTVAQLANATEEEPPAAADEEQSDEDAPAFLTGLDFSYWASEQENTYGPGLSWGLILLPNLLEMQITLGAMIGQTIYTIPIELRFSVPFELATWLDLYITAGPTLLFDRVASTWEHDFAASAAAGFELQPPGFDWGIRVQGDYNLRLVKEIVHTGGFTVGFLYRF